MFATFRHDKQLPAHLRRYTCMSHALRTLACGIELLQKLRKYQKVVDLYRVMLDQKLYCPNARGHWYDRLALILDYHLKDKPGVSQLSAHININQGKNCMFSIVGALQRTSSRKISTCIFFITIVGRDTYVLIVTWGPGNLDY